MKLFSETVNINPENSKSEKVNEYNQEASEKDIAGFKEEIEGVIEKKAEEIRLSETEDIEIYKEKVLELAGLDLESLDVKSLENSSHIDLELIRDNINETVNRFQKDKDLKERKLSKFEKFMESIRKHKKPLALGELSLYLSTLGAPALNFLVDEDVKVKIGDKEVLLKDLADKIMGAETKQKHFSQELTNIYEEVKDLPDRNIQHENIDESIEIAKEMFKYSEIIKDSEKKSLNDFAKDLSEKEFNNLIIGEWHGFGPTEQEAAYIIEEYIKNGGKVSAICFEGLSFTIPKDTEATKKFNEGNLSVQEMSKLVGFKNSLVETAKNHSIEIVGIEREKGLVQEDYYGRFKSMSERVGEITEEKKDSGIVVVYVGQGHATIDSWKNDNLLSELRESRPNYPSEKRALENNYTMKEYLEKIELKPIALQIEDWGQLTKAVDSSLAGRFEDLSKEDRIKFYDFSKKNWGNYAIEENETFVTEYPGEKNNTFSIVIPSKISESPPLLNGYKAIYDNPYLSEILNKKDLGSISYQPNIVFNIEQTPIIEINKTTGEPTKIYLPEQAKDFQENTKNRVALQENLKKILTQYDPKLHKKEQKIIINKAKSSQEDKEKTVDSLP